MAESDGKPFGLSVKAIIRDDCGRVLLLRRSSSSKGNPARWDLPGGKVDPGEPFDQALLREVREETGLTVSLSGLAGTAQSETPRLRIVYLVMGCRLIAGTIRLSDEHEDHRWAEPEETQAMDVVPQFKELLQKMAI
jgi:8-oxo-dGTP diphosphatase